MGYSLKDDLASTANQFVLTGRPRPTHLAPSQAIIRNLAGNIAVAIGANRTVALALAGVRATVEPIEAEVNSRVTPRSAMASLPPASRRVWLMKKADVAERLPRPHLPSAPADTKA